MATKVGGTGLLIVGGGGHAVVVAEAVSLQAGGLGLAGCLDDDASPAAARGPGGIERVGPLSQIQAVATGGGSWILGIGDLGARRTILDGLPGPARVGGAHTVAHPGAFVSPSATIGRGVFVGPGAIVHARARVADHAIINSGAIIEHDVRVGENAHVASGAVLAGGASVGAHTLVGSGSAVLPGIRVGNGCVVGAGSVVREDVPDGVTVVGVPARAT
ncbi:MAG: acetyltransferase [Phycisphaerales bacterium]